MIISQINKAKIKGKCFINYENSEEWMLLDIDVILKYGLKKGLDFTADLQLIVKAEQDLINAKRLAYSYATYKPRSEKQVEKRLAEKDFSREVIDICINFLKEFNLIDDKRFAYDFATMYIQKKPSGVARLKQELKAKGINEYFIYDVVSQFTDSELQLELAEKATIKKLRMLKTKPIEKQKNSLIQFLQRQGFSWDIIRKIIETQFKSNQ